MDFWEHALLSERKFGGSAADYADVHKFLDSSKMFYHHIKHRLLLHNTYGIELAMELFGDYLENSEGRIVLTRDVAQAHCREDLGGRVPTLGEWLRDSPELEAVAPMDFADPVVNGFMHRPYLRTGMACAYALTHSDFGIYLVEIFFGLERALLLRAELGAAGGDIKAWLKRYRFKQAWQYSPRAHERRLLPARGSTEEIENEH